MNARRRFSLVEVVIVAAILMVMMFMVFTSLIFSQRQVDTASAEQRAQSQTRALAHAVADDLRDAALVSLVPSSFSGATDLQYQVAVGYETTSGRIIAAPPTAIGKKRLRFANGELEKIDVDPRSGNLVRYVMGSGLKDVRLTLEGANQIRIRVEAEARTSSGETALAVSETVVFLRNQADLEN